MTPGMKITVRYFIQSLLKLLGWFALIMFGSFIAYLYVTSVFNIMSIGQNHSGRIY